jgi:type II secretory pathway pseudopilin PulG
MKKLRYVLGIAIAIALVVAVASMFRDRSAEIAFKKQCYAVREAADQYTADKKTPPTSIEDLQRAGYLKEGAFPAECVAGPTNVPRIDTPPADGKLAKASPEQSDCGKEYRDDGAIVIRDCAWPCDSSPSGTCFGSPVTQAKSFDIPYPPIAILLVFVALLVTWTNLRSHPLRRNGE